MFYFNQDFFCWRQFLRKARKPGFAILRNMVGPEMVPELVAQPFRDVDEEDIPVEAGSW
jgi:hypothetical protein